MYVTFCFSSRTVSLKKHPGRSECYDHSSLCQECQVSTVSHFQYSNDICKGEEHLFSGLQVVLKSILKALAPLMQIGLLVNIVFTIRGGVKNEKRIEDFCHSNDTFLQALFTPKKNICKKRNDRPAPLPPRAKVLFFHFFLSPPMQTCKILLSKGDTPPPPTPLVENLFCHKKA